MSPRIRLIVHFLTLLIVLCSEPTTLLFGQNGVRESGVLESKMREAGLVDIQSLDSTIVVDLIYSSNDNFMGYDVYGELESAYLVPTFAERLIKAQKLLKEEKGNQYSLVIYDAARPLSVQKKMWKLVKGTSDQQYVASPNNGGGRHNYGLAVDLSIIDLSTQQPLDMGSSVDHFGPESHIGQESLLVKKGMITLEAKENRAYLHNLMKRVGLRPIRKEWWHMQEIVSISEVRRQKLLDF